MTVYVIQGEHGGPVKIGYTGAADMNTRLRHVRTWHPDKLILRDHILDASRIHEKTIHRSLARWRMQGEWFRIDPPAENSYVYRYFTAYKAAHQQFFGCVDEAALPGVCDRAARAEHG